MEFPNKTKNIKLGGRVKLKGMDYGINFELLRTLIGNHGIIDELTFEHPEYVGIRREVTKDKVNLKRLKTDYNKNTCHRHGFCVDV